jgi:hypothetical protein
MPSSPIPPGVETLPTVTREWRKDIASELRSAIVLQEQRALDLQRATLAHADAKARAEHLLWRLECEKPGAAP